MAGTTVRAKCPACHGDVQFSVEAVDHTLNCEHCGATFRPKAKAKPEPTPELSLGKQMDAFAVVAPVRAIPRRPSRTKWIVGAVVTLLLAAIGAAAYVNRDQLSQGKGAEQKNKATPKAEPKPEIKTKEDAPKQADAAFPRRMLVVSVNQYLYCHPILFGSSKRSPAALLERLSDKWRIPRDQLFLLTDAKNNRSSTPPIKSVMEKTIESFLASSRAQDRIVMLYAGHAAVLDDKSYMVPLDGELGVAETMIPLSWLAEKLKSCKARQKLLIFDGCRADVSRGVERPSPGPMDPKLEAELKAMPAGVQVWTSCAANQSSLEYQYQAVAGNDFEGSVFLNCFFHAFLKGGPAKQLPSDVLPIEDLAVRVGKLTQSAANALAKQTQIQYLCVGNMRRFFFITRGFRHCLSMKI